MIKSLLGMRWISIGLKIIKWGSVAAVVGYLSWIVWSNHNLRQELAVVESRIDMIQSTANELQRRMRITEEELDTLNEQRLQSRRELEEIRRTIQESDLDQLEEDEIKDLYQELLDEITNGLRQISDNQ